jgi:NAD(P)-dependent dehydrogenase (short-subunit alcohol dehydrogenase family)
MRLKGKVAIVTGGSQGIGEAIALRYAAEGARVAVVYHANDAAAQAVVRRIAAAGGEAKPVKADCSKVAEIERMTAEVIQHFGTVDILVNNAGVFRTVPVVETTEAIWDEQLDLNLRGAFFCVKAVLPEFQRKGRGKVINITSIAGVGAFPNCPAYCASKGGLEILTKALAAELGKQNINVNSLAPGNVATQLNAHLRRPGNEAYIDLMRTMTPTGRDFLSVEEMTGTAVFLASDDASAIHGATLMVDAGWSAI